MNRMSGPVRSDKKKDAPEVDRRNVAMIWNKVYDLERALEQSLARVEKLEGKVNQLIYSANQGG